MLTPWNQVAITWGCIGALIGMLSGLIAYFAFGYRGFPLIHP